MSGVEAKMNKATIEIMERRNPMKKYFAIGITVLGLLLFTNCVMYSPSDGYGGTYTEPPDSPYVEPESPYVEPETPPVEEYDQPLGEMDSSYFYDYLSDYGQWVRYPGYDYVWMPHGMAAGWRPYTYGRWVWTEYGWTWVSYFRWGWIPFHYGRWVFEPGFGWFWVPGTVWAPAWVIWRYGGSWIGWAPLPPHYPYYPGRGLYLDHIDISDDCWNFVDRRHFDANDVHSYILPPRRNPEFVRSTISKAQLEDRNGRIINNGLDRGEVERLTKRAVPTYKVEKVATPQADKLSSGHVAIYKPEVKAHSSAAPRKFVTKDEAQKKNKGRTDTRVVRKTEPAPAKVARVEDPQGASSRRPVSTTPTRNVRTLPKAEALAPVESPRVYSLPKAVSNPPSTGTYRSLPKAESPAIERQARVSAEPATAAKRQAVAPAPAPKVLTSQPAPVLEKKAPVVREQVVRASNTGTVRTAERTVVKKETKAATESAKVKRQDESRSASNDSRTSTPRRKNR